MTLLDKIEPLFVRAADGIFARMPQQPPSKKRLGEITIYSHRGEHDNRNVVENSMVAFERALTAGVGGIEFDIRWTKDLIPVVFHDEDLKRIFNAPEKVATLTLAQLQRDFPEIPCLEEVIAVFGGRLHLMIELKIEHFPDPKRQRDCLVSALNALDAGRDFNLISFSPQLFELFHGFPAKTYLPIARANAGPMSKLSLDEKFGGLTGHYLFVNRAMIERHQSAFQKIGTGFVHSRNCLFREINRGVDWIFSNHAGWLQNLVNEMDGYDR